jgi:hypothetical protein
MGRTTIKQVAVEEVPEVAAYEGAKAMYESFKAAHLPVVEKLQEFLEYVNQTKEAAEKAVRAAGISCGDFDLYQQVDKVDGDTVLNAVGRDVFIGMGGTIKVKSEAKIGVKQLKTALAQKTITQDLYDEVIKVENRYHMPPTGALP